MLTWVLHTFSFLPRSPFLKGV